METSGDVSVAEVRTAVRGEARCEHFVLAEEEREKLNTALLKWIARPADAEDEEKKPERKYHPMEKRPPEEGPKEVRSQV